MSRKTFRRNLCHLHVPLLMPSLCATLYGVVYALLLTTGRAFRAILRPIGTATIKLAAWAIPSVLSKWYALIESCQKYLLLWTLSEAPYRVEGLYYTNDPGVWLIYLYRTQRSSHAYIDETSQGGKILESGVFEVGNLGQKMGRDRAIFMGLNESWDYEI